MLIATFLASLLPLFCFLQAPGTQKPWITVPAAPFWQNRAVADLDGDGDNELVITSGVPETAFPGPNPFRLFVLDDHGRTLPGWPAVINPVGAVTGGAHPVLVDFDGDERLEVVVAEIQLADPGSMPPSRIHAFDRRGHPLRGWPVTVPVSHAHPEALLEVDVAAGDLDEDGTPEILATVMWYGPAAGGFLPDAQVHAFRTDGVPVPGWPITLPGLTARFLPAIGKVLPGAGQQVVLGDVDGRLHVIDGDGTVLRTIQVPGGPASLQRVPNLILVNLDSDPEQEIIFNDHNFAGLISAVDADDSPVPGWPVASEGVVFCGMAYGDVTGDGQPELVAATQPVAFVNSTRIHAFSAQGTTLAGFPFSAPMSAWDLPFPIVGDVSGDGVADIVYQTVDEIDVDTHSRIRAYMSTGQSIFDLDYPRLPMFETPTLADFNRNGIVDLVTNTAANSFPDATGSVFVTDLGVRYRPATMHWPKFQLNELNNSSTRPQH